MNEDFISYVWAFRLYSGDPGLVDGRAFTVESPGTVNRDAGPDFLGARIRIGNTLWVGNVEVHLKASDWKAHGHQNDKAYETVVLHVVYQHDADIVLSDGTSLPVFELKNRIDATLYTRYLQFMASPREVPCAGLLQAGKLPVQGQWLISLGLQRVIRKGAELGFLLKRTGDDWLELLYVCFCRSFGNKVNDDIFEMLALRTPLKLVRKYSGSREHLEALLFGQSGLLPDRSDGEDDPYVYSLREHYSGILYQHRCEPMEPHHWKFLRTRPANFPTIRIAQLSALLGGFISINPLSVGEIRQWMEEAVHIPVSPYWQGHYHFGKKCDGLPVCIGRESVQRIVINGLGPCLVRYGEVYKDHHFITGLVDFVSSLPAENNLVSRTWNSVGIRAGSALESQGLTELYNEYCRMKKCLECRFGHHLLALAVDGK